MDFALTIAGELRRTAQRHPGVAAFHFRGRDITYADWDAYADRFARALLAAGVRKGHRLPLLLPALPDYLPSYAGPPRTGVPPAGTTTRSGRQETAETRANADPRLVLPVEAAEDARFLPLIEAARTAAPSLERIVRFAGEGPGTLAEL